MRESFDCYASKRHIAPRLKEIQKLAEDEFYKIRFSHAVEYDNDQVYPDKILTRIEYEKLRDSLKLKHFWRGVEKAYVRIVSNYRDYELNNFATVLNRVLRISGTGSVFAARDGIDRHILNVLTSTYLYTSLLRIKRRDNELNDYTLKNSDEIRSIHEVKTVFKDKTNHFHSKKYQYTFVSVLRNKINHGVDLVRTTELGGEWSVRHEHTEPDAQVGPLRKDKRYVLFDQKILKQEAKNIIDNNKHYSAVEQTIPDSFYLREAMRKYVDLLSEAHSEIRLHANLKMKAVDRFICSYIDIDAQESGIEASLMKHTGENEHEVTALGSSQSQAITDNESAIAPLHLEHYLMPGEPGAVPKHT